MGGCQESLRECMRWLVERGRFRSMCVGGASLGVRAQGRLQVVVLPELVQLVGPDSPVGMADESEFERREKYERISDIRPSSFVAGACMGCGRVIGERAKRWWRLSDGACKCVWAVELSSCSSCMGPRTLHSPVGMADESLFEWR